MRFTASIAVVVVATAVAHADPPGLTTPTLTPPHEAHRKSVATALALAIGTTAVGAGLLFAADRENATAQFNAGPEFLLISGGAGVLVGPSLGRIYAHDPWSWGLLIRTVGFAAYAGGGALSGTCNVGPGSPGGSYGCNSPPIAIAGGIVYVVGSLLEIESTPDAVERYNRRHGMIDVGVAPVVAPGGRGGGLGVVGRW